MHSVGSSTTLHRVNDNSVPLWPRGTKYLRPDIGSAWFSGALLACLASNNAELVIISTVWAFGPALYHIISSCPESTANNPPISWARAETLQEEGWCWGGSLDYVTSSGRPLELFPPLLREGKKRPFHYWDCHSQFGLTVSMHKASWIFPPTCSHSTPTQPTPPPPHTHTHAIPPSPPPAADRRGDSLIRSSIVAVNSGFPEHLDRQVTAGSELPLSPWPRAVCACECGSMLADTQLHIKSNCFCVCKSPFVLYLWTSESMFVYLCAYVERGDNCVCFCHISRCKHNCVCAFESVCASFKWGSVLQSSIWMSTTFAVQ